MSEFFNSEHLGKSKFIFWYGQVLGDWECNENPEIHDRDDVPGWGKRYKVLIFGRDPQEISKGLTNEQAVMAEVILPVTAGSGIGGANMTPQITQNSYVMGFYKDGINGREPVILGIVPNIPQTRLFEYDKNSQTKRYYPATGYNPEIDWHLINKSKIFYDGSGTNENTTDPNSNHAELHIQLYDGAKTDYIPKTYKCDGEKGELKGVQKSIQDGLNAINKIKKETQNFQNAVTSLPTSVSSIINSITTGVSSLIKNLIQKMRNFALNGFNNTIKEIVNLVPPNLKPNVRIVSETGTDTLSCVFNKITELLFSLIFDSIDRLVLGSVNAAVCTVESIIGDVLSNILGDITDAIDSALSFISNIVGKIGSFAGKLTNALDILAAILKFFSCEDEIECSDIDEWSFWYGPRSLAEDIDFNIGETLDNIGTNSGGGCNTAQRLCGPPTVKLLNGYGSGFEANSVISSSGALLAFDIINSGSNYSSRPVVSFSDNCGVGNGAVIIPIVLNPTSTKNLYNNNTFTDYSTSSTFGGNPSSTTGSNVIQNGNTTIPTSSNNENNNGSIQDLIILDEGVGYLNTPNGSTGGGGNLFTGPEDTILYQNETNNYAPYGPNETIDVSSGDDIYLPPGTTVDVFDSDGNIVQTITGQGQVTPIPILNDGVLTTPVPVNDFNNVDELVFSLTGRLSDSHCQNTSGEYKVALKLKNIFVTNSGINYQDTDEIVMTPSLGTILKPKFDTAGRLITVDVSRPGIGFTERPSINIRSTTGINARMVPVFEVIRRCDIPEEEFNIPAGTPLINVVDCVGKVNGI